MAITVWELQSCLSWEDAASSAEGITQNNVSYICWRKSDHFVWSIMCLKWIKTLLKTVSSFALTSFDLFNLFNLLNSFRKCLNQFTSLPKSLNMSLICRAVNKYYSSAGHHEQKKKTTVQIKFLAVIIK